MRVVPIHHITMSLASYRTGYKISKILSPNFPDFQNVQNFKISKILKNFQKFPKCPKFLKITEIPKLPDQNIRANFLEILEFLEI